jgi:carboxypeptidase C (cathepsin A)
MTKHFATFASIVTLLAAPAIVAQGRGGRGGFEQAQQAAQAPAGATGATTYRPPPPEEKTVVTHHEGRFGGNTIKYTATAATYVIKADDGQPKATFFFTAYTRDGVDDMTHRPLTFVYNGGPGSATMWTHMGLGPKRVLLTDDGQGMPAPYSAVENGDCVLDATDMVFVDAIGTGYSRPAPGENRTQFYGVSEDAQWFADFIWQYVTRNTRWTSPKFLLGESYGTTRSAMLAGTLLQRRSMFMSGIMLLSAVGFGNFGADDRYAFELPSYVTSAWFHHLLPPDLQSLNMEQIAQKAREFAHGEYAQALEKGDEISPAEKQKVIKDLAHYTGLSTAYVEETNLRISPQRWFKELLRSKRETMGRLDARFTGQDYDAAGEGEEYDPSWATYTGAYAAMWQDYVRKDLNWVTDGWYNVSGNVRPWDEGRPGQPAESLRAAMTQERHLKLMVMCGYYDHATPFNGIEHTVSHMSLEPNIRKNVSFVYYETGHMVYIDKKAREKMRKDVIGFITMASKQ